MLTINGYRITEQLYQSSNSLVYRGYREPEEQPVILKFLKPDYPTQEELTRYKQEYEITHNLNLEGVVKAEHAENYQKTLVIIFEDFGGDSLKILMEDARGSAFVPMPIDEFLTLAIKIAQSLAEIHSSQIIHKDINPSNIVLNPETGQLKIIDFGISTVLSRENPTLKNPNVLEGTLAYISPEQTGRMNRFLDYRSDFYSLGVTFYELLTNQLPFAAMEAMELVHCHLAKQPIPPHEIRSEIPKAVSDIVLKLMAKTAEERYQSAWGIKTDLESCRQQLQERGKIESFPLAREDISDKFQIPQKLYGREAEIQTLLAAFERVSQGIPLNPQSSGGREMILVTGYAGVGKSTLVKEIHKPITAKRGNFISGKFEQYQRNIPYYALSQAFNEFCHQLLSESTAVLNEWQEKIIAAVANNGQVLIDVIPDLELVIGKQPPVAQVGPTEAQNRFNLVFQNLLKAICQPSHPLVLFIDDLQWAEPGSLQLLKLLMSEREIQYLLLVGAYRDNEVDATHPLMMILESIKKESKGFSSIHLQNLVKQDVNTLISEALVCQPKSSQPLTDLVYAKTQGNAFFTNEFLKSLYTESLLKFDRNKGKWKCNLTQIQEKGMTENVIELMAGKIQKLREEPQQVLKMAACSGNQFELETLAVVCEKSPKETAVLMRAPVEEGLVLPIGDAYKSIELDVPMPGGGLVEYKFAHDRIQQAAYSLIGETKKQATHLQIGRLLLANTNADELTENIFELVDQFNEGIALISDEQELVKLAELNLIAAQKAKAATAYGSAL